MFHAQGQENPFDPFSRSEAGSNKTHRTRISPELESPNILVLTNRIDLDDQIAKRFEACGLPNPVQIESVADLHALIRSGSAGLTRLSTIFKFEGSTDPVPDSENWIVLVEAFVHGRRMRLTVKVTPGGSIVTYYRNGFFVEVPAAVAAGDGDATIRHVLELWLRRRVEDDAGAFARRYARKLGEGPKGIRIKDQKHLWGSCGKDRIINLNWRLIFMPKTVLEYAVVHELCHLKHRHHSAAFWNRVRRLLPDYEPRKAWLDRHGPAFEL